ncbi:MAG: type II toxin-antitoxin system RelE/ParE family toxin [Bryobacteraceae bacterium]
MSIVHKRASAKRDLVEQYVYLAEHAGGETADRFLANAGESFCDLSRNPGMGAPMFCRSPKLAGLRKWRLAGLKTF